MYFTIFQYEGHAPSMIVHKEPAKPYGDYVEDLAQYEGYLNVTRRPTFDEAVILFDLCQTNTLCAGIKSATTVKLEPTIYYALFNNQTGHYLSAGLNSSSLEELAQGYWEDVSPDSGLAPPTEDIIAMAEANGFDIADDRLPFFN